MRSSATRCPGRAGRAVRFGLAAGTVALVLAGCSLGRSGPDRPSGSGSGGTAPATRHQTFPVAAEGYAPISADFPARPVAVRPTSTEGVRFELYQVKRLRGGRAATVVFALHNTGGDVDIRRAAEGLEASPNSVEIYPTGISLVDPVGLKSYGTFVENPDYLRSRCLCTLVWELDSPDTVKTLRSGERRFYASEVAAPPADVTTVTVQAGVAAVPGARITG